VVISADATDKQVKRLLDAGAADYLTKPLDLPRFLDVIRRFAKVAAPTG
jgi:response regulator of citrate/malate metabolism